MGSLDPLRLVSLLVGSFLDRVPRYVLAAVLVVSPADRPMTVLPGFLEN
jgi:hypothetical protein